MFGSGDMEWELEGILRDKSFLVSESISVEFIPKSAPYQKVSVLVIEFKPERLQKFDTYNRRWRQLLPPFAPWRLVSHQTLAPNWNSASFFSETVRPFW